MERVLHKTCIKGTRYKLGFSFEPLQFTFRLLNLNHKARYAVDRYTTFH